MTIEEARECIPNFKAFENEVCNSCVENDWYCPSRCRILEKASKLDFERIQKSYARNDGEMWKVMRYIKRAKV